MLTEKGNCYLWHILPTQTFLLKKIFGPQKNYACYFDIRALNNYWHTMLIINLPHRMILSLEYPGSQFKILFYDTPLSSISWWIYTLQIRRLWCHCLCDIQGTLCLGNCSIAQCKLSFLTTMFSTEIKCTTLDVPDTDDGFMFSQLTYW